MGSDLLAPLAYLAVEFPGGRITGEGFSLVHDLAARGIITVLDLEFIAKSADGTVSKVRLEDVQHASDVDITRWRGAYTGLLDQDDVDTVAAAIEPGSLVGILVYENAWAAPLMAAIDANGARLVGAGGIDSDELLTTLDATDPS